MWVYHKQTCSFLWWYYCISAYNNSVLLYWSIIFEGWNLYGNHLKESCNQGHIGSNFQAKTLIWNGLWYAVDKIEEIGYFCIKPAATKPKSLDISPVLSYLWNAKLIATLNYLINKHSFIKYFESAQNNV